VSDVSCQELVELVTDYFDDALPADERRSFEEHIAICGACTRHLEHLRVTIQAVGEVRDDSIDPETRERLLAAYRDWKRGARR
jgi:anti-sigma factor RsiW